MVEPVFGTLTQFMGLRKINTIALKQANKVMHLSAIAYGLKKYLKFEQKRVKSGAGSALLLNSLKTVLANVIHLVLSPSDFSLPQYTAFIKNALRRAILK